MPGTLHLMVGLPCSGKSTRARELSKSLPAALLSPDPWQLALFGDDCGEAEHDARHSAIELQLWNLAQELLVMGTNVILDYGFWAKEERDGLRRAARRLGADTVVHYMDAPLEEIRVRLEKRNREEGQFCIPFESILEWSKLFQAPLPEELEAR